MDPSALVQVVEELLTPRSFSISTRCGERRITVKLTAKSVYLSIDGVVVDSEEVTIFVNRSEPILERYIKEGNDEHLIQVFGKNGMTRGKIKICFDGKYVAGDDFSQEKYQFLSKMIHLKDWFSRQPSLGSDETHNTSQRAAEVSLEASQPTSRRG